MLIFDDIELVYLANPKTGTTSFEHAFAKFANLELSGQLPKHAPFRRFKKKFPRIARKYETVTCVRDPLETLYSWYRYRSRLALRGDPNSTHGMTFEEFFKEWCKDEPARFADVSASVGFVLNARGKLVKGLKIFRYGKSPGVHEFVADRLGQTVPETRKNISRNDKGERGPSLESRVDTGHKKLQIAYDIYSSIDFVSSL